MGELWSQKALSLTPYVAGEQPEENLIKLNTNENAYAPSPCVKAVVEDACGDLRKYPPADGGPFREAAARMNGLRREEIFCANGSDEALSFAFMAFFDPGEPVATPGIGYSFYPVWANLFGLTLKRIPLKEDYRVDVEALKGYRNIVLANPNAPTGIALSEKDLRSVIENCEGVAVIDEAYAGFGSVSALPWVREYENLVVVRTLSKAYALAGLRAGYAAAQENLIRALETVKDSFNSYPVDRLAQAAAAAALEDREWHESTCARIAGTRERVSLALRDMGLFVLPSESNFLFVRFESPDAATVFKRLRERKILVRYFKDEETKDFLRVTVGTDDEMEALIAALKEIL